MNLPTLPEFLQRWLGSSPLVAWLLYGGLGLVLLILVLVLWLRFGRGPRRRRSYHRARQLLQQQAWSEALAEVEHLESIGRLSTAWQGRARNAAGECHRVAAETALLEKRYEDCLDHFLTSARLLNLKEADVRTRVLEAMLEEARRLFATTLGKDTSAVHQLLARVFALEPTQPEAQFWQALCEVRDGSFDQAVTSLQAARDGAGNRILDPSLYLGALLLQFNRPQEAVRCLADAHRIEAESPFVAWQLGMALIAAKGAQTTGASMTEPKPETPHSELTLAVRALQRALGPQGLPLWFKTPQRAWVEGMPGPTRSYVRRLAAKYPYTCPVMGADVSVMIRQGQMALAQAQYRMGNFQEAANLYTAALREGAPSLPLLRGLGLALARLEQYDQAFIHLKTAHEREEPRNPLTAGYLALCAAKGKPMRPEDKPNNIAWSISLLASFSVPADLEWASLSSAIYAEARAIGLRVGVEDQTRVCDLLAGVSAADPQAAAAYDHLAATFPEAVRPEHAWLYCRAAQQHGVQGERDLELFDRTFEARSAAQEYYARRGWNLDDVEYTFLERCADRRPGHFPDALGPDYAPRGQCLLLARSEQNEQAGLKDAARASAEVLLKLAPHSTRGHDRLAELCYRSGDRERAIALLDSWHALDPVDYKPLVRRAVIEQEQSKLAESRATIDQALERAIGAARAAVAFLAAKLSLREDLVRSGCVSAASSENGSPLPPSSPRRVTHSERVLHLLDACLKADPNHTEALSCLAAVRSMLGDQEGLARQAAAMHRPEVKNERFQFLAAVCQLAAHEYHPVVETAARGAVDNSHLAVESAYLMGWAFLHLNNMTAANLALQKVANTPDSPSVHHARALLGRIGFTRGAYEDAIRWWSALDPEKRGQWQLDEALRGSVFLAGLSALQADRFEQAAERFRQAIQLGPDDARLGPLLTLALVKAGQQKLYNHTPATANQTLVSAGAATLVPAEQAVEWLPEDAALEARSPDHPGPGVPAVVAGAVPVDGHPPAHYEDAALLLEQGVQAGCKDPAVIYLLALAHKRRGSTREARNALRQIDPPDANVLLQMGLLSLRESKAGVLQPLYQAEQEFTRAWQADPGSYEASYNLLLTRLSSGQLDAAAALIPQVLDIAPDPDERRLLTLLLVLLPGAQLADGGSPSDPLLVQMSPADEQRLLKLIRSLSQLEVIRSLLQALAKARPDSAAVQEAYLEAVLVSARSALDLYDWVGAERVLAPLEQVKWTSRPMQAALLNLRGCCACLAQDFEGGIRHFSSAVRQAGNDARLHQNLALAQEWNGQLLQADPHWNRFVDLLDRRLPVPPGWPDYVERLAYESLGRLATCYSDKERWATALGYLERANHLRPREVDVLERLFQIYLQLNRVDDARRVLRQLRALKPNEPQHELYELNLIRVKSIDDLDRKLNELERIIKRFPHDPRVQDKAAEETGHLIGTMATLYDQLTEQVGKVVNQVRHLPNSQVNWPAVADVMHEMRGEYQKLRRATGKCMTLALTEEQRRNLRDLGGRIDRKIEVCRSWGA